MSIRRNPMAPLAVVAALLAGEVGTVCLDAVHYLKYRRAGRTGRRNDWLSVMAGRIPAWVIVLIFGSFGDAS